MWIRAFDYLGLKYYPRTGLVDLEANLIMERVLDCQPDPLWIVKFEQWMIYLHNIGL